MSAAPSAPVSAGAASASSATAPATPATPPQSVVPFVRGSGLGRYKFYSKSLSLTSTSQDLGPIDVKAYDYMRSILVTVTNTAAGGASGTAQADAPFNVITNVQVKQPNGQTMYQVSSGLHAGLIHKYGGYAGYNDPWADPNFLNNGSQSTFAFRIPFELNIRDALGSLPNKNAAAPFDLELTLNTLSNVYGASQGTSPTFTVEAWLEAWDQPPTSLGGQQVQTTPPNVNTLQRWTEQNITITSGQFDARVRKLGNYLRELIFVAKATGVRADSGFPDPLQIVLDEDVKDNISLANFKRTIYEIWGYGNLMEGTAAVANIVANDTSGGRNLGVFPYSYAHEFDGQFGHENGDLYLPTIESEDYLLRGSWGGSLTSLVALVDEVLPQGNIFS
jgi:hypothetical protein